MEVNRELLRKRPGSGGGNRALARNPQFWTPELDDKYGSPHTPDDEEDMNRSVDADGESPTIDRKMAYETIGRIVDREFADAVLRASKQYGSRVAGNKELMSAIDTLIGDGFVFGEEDLDHARHSYRERMEARRNGYSDDGIGSWYPKAKLPESKESPFNGMSIPQMKFLNEFYDSEEEDPDFDEEDLPYCDGCMEEAEELRPLSDWAEHFAQEEGWSPEQVEAVDDYIFNAGDDERCETCAMTKFHSIFDEM